MPGKARKKSEQMSREEREKRLSSAYNRASQELRDRYRDEFNDLYATHAQDLGVEWKPRLRPEQKAEQELYTIFEAWPDLKERVLAQARADSEPDEPEESEPAADETAEPGSEDETGVESEDEESPPDRE